MSRKHRKGGGCSCDSLFYQLKTNVFVCCRCERFLENILHELQNSCNTRNKNNTIIIRSHSITSSTAFSTGAQATCGAIVTLVTTAIDRILVNSIFTSYLLLSIKSYNANQMDQINKRICFKFNIPCLYY